MRYLARIIAVGLDVALEHADTEHPWVSLARTPTELTGRVSPDARYHEAFIDGTRTYRLSGTRGTAPMLAIGVYAGKLGLKEESRLVEANWLDTGGHTEGLVNFHRARTDAPLPAFSVELASA